MGLDFGLHTNLLEDPSRGILCDEDDNDDDDVNVARCRLACREEEAAMYDDAAGLRSADDETIIL